MYADKCARLRLRLHLRAACKTLPAEIAGRIKPAVSALGAADAGDTHPVTVSAVLRHGGP